MATPAFRANGVQITSSAATPVVATKQGVWVDNVATPNLRYDDGTNSNLVAAIAASAKGDLAVFNGTNWVKVPLGTNTQVLTADNTQASGVKWAAGGGGGSTTLAAAYTNGASATDVTLLLNSTNGPVILKDNASPIGTLFKMQTSAAASLWSWAAGSFAGTPSAATSGATAPWSFTAPASTGQTASTEVNGALWDHSATRTWATGALTTQREMLIKAPTYAFAAASTVSDAVTFGVTGAPAAGTNATLTRAWAIRWEGGLVGSNAAVNMATTVASNGSRSAFIINDVNGGAGDKQIELQVGGVQKALIYASGGVTAYRAGSGQTETDLMSPNGNGVVGVQGSIAYIAVGSTEIDVVTGTMRPVSNGGGGAGITSGDSTHNWNGVYSAWFSSKTGSQLTAAATITPTSGAHHVTGATTITTIATTNVPSSGTVYLTLIADGGTITLNTGGNIGANCTIAINTQRTFFFDGTTWYPEN